MESTGLMKYVSLPRAKRGRVAGVGAPSTSASGSCFTSGSGRAGAAGVRAGAAGGAACATGASEGAAAGASSVCARDGADARADASVHASATREAAEKDGFMGGDSLGLHSRRGDRRPRSSHGHGRRRKTARDGG